TDKGQVPLALSLAAIPAKQVPYLLVANRKEEAANVLKQPVEGEAIESTLVRLGYAEGYARLGDYKKALEIVKAPGGTPEARVNAALAAAAVALADHKTDGAGGHASALVREAMTAYGELKERPDWLAHQLGAVAARTDVANQVEKHIDSMPLWLQGWARLA